MGSDRTGQHQRGTFSILSIIFAMLLSTHSLVAAQKEFQFNRDYVGVSFSPYVKNWETDGIGGGWNSYSVTDIRIMFRLIRGKFSKVATHAIGAQPIPGLSTRYKLADALVAEAAALLNRNENSTFKIIQGINTTHTNKTAQASEIFNALNATRFANEISPSTVVGLVFPENVEVLEIIVPIVGLNQSDWNKDLQVGARLKNCTVRTESLEQHAKQLNFVMCTIFPDFSCNTTELAVNSVIEQYNASAELLKSINLRLQVQIGETGWPSFGKDEKLYNVANLKKYWELIGEWAESNQIVVYMHEAFDQPYKSDPRRTDPTDMMGRFGIWGYFGWWKRTDTYNNNPNTYIEKIVELPKFEDNDKEPDNTAVFVAVPIVSLLIIGTVTWYLNRMKKAREARLRLLLTQDEIDEFEQGATGPTAINEPWNLPYQREYEIPKDELDIHRETVLGSGAFGIVYHGFVAQNNGRREVAIKTVKTGSAAKELRNLLSEIKIMIYIGKHDNIVGLIGAHTADLKDGSVFLAAEFCGLGSLEKFLRKYPYNYGDSQYQNVFSAEIGVSTGYQNAPQQVSIDIGNGTDDVRYVNAPKHTAADAVSQLQIRIEMSDLLNWSYEIANGMEYLGTKNVIHADLAARNILLTADKAAKITDFGLSRKLYEYTQYVKKQQEPLPWRWMAVESLRNMTFSSQSDVWSYGVTLWEIYSLGGIPYPGLSWDISFLEQLDNGLRMHQPRLADEDIYQQMINTWHASPVSRPSFTDLKDFFLKKCFASVSSL